MPGRLSKDSLLSTPARPQSPSRAISSAASSTMEHLKRNALSGLANQLKPHHHHHADKRQHSKERPSLSSKASSGSSPSLKPKQQQSGNTMTVVVESPPNIFFGSPKHSSGALFSGQLRLKIVDPEVTLTNFTMNLVANINAMRPVVRDCPDCSLKKTQLFKWTFITEKKTLKAGEHSFPFSYLIPGHLPATTHGHLGDLEYILDARAKTTTGAEIVLRKPLPISRALHPLPEKTSIRVFPPTNLTALLQFPPIIHPIGQSNALLKISGISSKAPRDPSILLRWRLRKMSWRLEELEKMVSPACEKHAGKVGGLGRGVMHEDVRILGSEEMKEGWKTDLDDGNIEMEFPVSANGLGSLGHGGSGQRPLCDVDSPTGLSVSHSIVIELVIAEEWAPTKAPTRSTPTGAARVLRAQFQVAVTERAGMGISWDEESPPTYEDVPDSPPLYSNPNDFTAYHHHTSGTSANGYAAENFEISPLDELEELSLGDLRRPRHIARDSHTLRTASTGPTSSSATTATSTDSPSSNSTSTSTRGMIATPRSQLNGHLNGQSNGSSASENPLTNGNALNGTEQGALTDLANTTSPSGVSSSNANAGPGPDGLPAYSTRGARYEVNDTSSSSSSSNNQSRSFSSPPTSNSTTQQQRNHQSQQASQQYNTTQQDQRGRPRITSPDARARELRSIMLEEDERFDAQRRRRDSVTSSDGDDEDGRGRRESVGQGTA